MSLLELDSRNPFGTDIEGARYADSPSDTDFYMLYPRKRTIRVILGQLGDMTRMSAPELDIVVDGSDRGQAWARFLDQIRGREDGAWLAFDVGPTRPDEIAEGLNAPEDEDWSEPACDAGE
jgi:hypothetical protein